MDSSVLHRTRIKMCGTTRVEDITAAVHAGIDALGFIFVAKSPRYLSASRAACLIAKVPPFITRVGVFQNASFEEVQGIVETCGLTQVQLHGQETPEYCREMKNWRRGLSVCKAFRVGANHVPQQLDAYAAIVDAVLFDTFVEGIAGGTGVCFDWALIDNLAPSIPIILAGGLNPANVVAAIKTVRPYAIDINSGVESSPGKKDPVLLQTLVANVRRMEQSMLGVAADKAL